MASPRNSSEGRHRKRPPATTPEARENQMISLAYDEAERQLRDGSASAMVVTHFLKLGTSKNQLELKKLENETALLEARAGQIGSEKKMEEMYNKAIRAMRGYQGLEEDDDGLD